MNKTGASKQQQKKTETEKKKSVSMLKIKPTLVDTAADPVSQGIEQGVV